MHQRRHPRGDIVRAAHVILTDQHMPAAIPRVGIINRANPVFARPVQFEIAEIAPVQAADHRQDMWVRDQGLQRVAMCLQRAGLFKECGDARVVLPAVKGPQIVDTRRAQFNVLAQPWDIAAVQWPDRFGRAQGVASVGAGLPQRRPGWRRMHDPAVGHLPERHRQHPMHRANGCCDTHQRKPGQQSRPFRAVQPDGHLAALCAERLESRKRLSDGQIRRCSQTQPALTCIAERQENIRANLYIISGAVRHGAVCQRHIKSHNQVLSVICGVAGWACVSARAKAQRSARFTATGSTDICVSSG